MPSGVAKNENKSQKFPRQESKKKRNESKIVSDLGNGNPSQKTAKAEAN